MWPEIAGWDFRVPWISCHDLGVVAAAVLADRDRYVGQDLRLAADVRSLADCRHAFEEVTGRPPRSFPMPQWLFRRFTPDTVQMWKYCRAEPPVVDTSITRSIHPGAMTVEARLRRRTAVLTRS